MTPEEKLKFAQELIQKEICALQQEIEERKQEVESSDPLISYEQRTDAEMFVIFAEEAKIRLEVILEKINL